MQCAEIFATTVYQVCGISYKKQRPHDVERDSHDEEKQNENTRPEIIEPASCTQE
jgi:hypothetical protein